MVGSMNKIVDGVELLRMIRDGEIERGRKINLIHYTDNYSDTYYFSGCNIRHLKGDYEIGSERLLNKKFKYELLDKEIDIQAIEEIDYEVNFGYVNCGNMTKEVKEGLNTQFNNINEKLNQLIKAIKQLDKKINK